MRKFKYGRGYIQIRTPFETVQFPIINRIFGRLLADDIVSVQPLSVDGQDLFRRLLEEERKFLKGFRKFKYGK